MENVYEGINEEYLDFDPNEIIGIFEKEVSRNFEGAKNRLSLEDIPFEHKVFEVRDKHKVLESALKKRGYCLDDCNNIIPENPSPDYPRFEGKPVGIAFLCGKRLMETNDLEEGMEEAREDLYVCLRELGITSQ